MAVALAAGLRLYRLGEWPPGLYRDEAYNGLDALDVLQGEFRVFFPANNGREPSYIYLVALSIALLGPSAFAVRLPAALAGALATAPAYLLGREWFGRAAGILAAFLWAITFWPVHLGRIGLRAGLLAPLLALAFWLGTRAYRRRRAALWLAAGLVYGLSFYTYLAARFTPLLLALFAAYLVLTGRRERLWDEGRALGFVLGAALALMPLAAVMAADPSLVFGRAGQVSILSPSINGGDPFGALLGNAGRALGMYLWRGDSILRHNALLNYDAILKADNPAGRPVFDLLMAAPFLVGLVWCLRHWRRPAAAFLVLWQLVMLGPTILAEDAPHFLRAAGVLPGAVFFPAIGLALLWDWARLPVVGRRSAVVLLLAGSLALTARDYARYGAQSDVAYMWESAAAELARSAQASAREAAVYLDERFAEGWPSVRFLLNDRPANLFRPEDGPLGIIGEPAVVYAWPYGSLDFLSGIAPPALVEVSAGPLARGDLEPEPYSLYTRYEIRPGPAETGSQGSFDDLFALRSAAAAPVAPDELAVALRWEPLMATDRMPNVFIHVVGPEGMLAQHDGPLAGGLWPAGQWRPGLSVGESHNLLLPRPFDPEGDSVRVGLYWPDSGERLPVVDERGAAVDDQIVIRPGVAP
jgi:4-amino-4-deoxy-L-arabinose transferase-like glycosyltransferase